MLLYREIHFALKKYGKSSHTEKGFTAYLPFIPFPVFSVFTLTILLRIMVMQATVCPSFLIHPSFVSYHALMSAAFAVLCIRRMS